MPHHRSPPGLVVLVGLLVVCPALAVTVFPSNTAPRAYDHGGLPPAPISSQDIFKLSCPQEYSTHGNATVQFSSYDSFPSDDPILSSSDGFIRGAIDAWAQHQHLVIRPDEVWFAILTQMNFYMNKNAEQVRHLFVNHEGKQTILVKGEMLEVILKDIGAAIQERVKTAWLLDWITPGFTTSTPNDELTANVLMMGMMQTFFEFEFQIICGLPSVTLLGTKSDWEKMLAKLDQLPIFGEEPEAYAKQMRPLLSRFVKTFDSPDDPDIRAFWNNIVVADPNDRGICGLPPWFISGWVLGFVYWGDDGEPLSKPRTKYWMTDYENTPETPLALDGIEYYSLSIEDLPMGYAKAPVTMIKYDGMERFPAYVLAGNIAKKVTSGVPDGYAEALKRFNGSEVDTTLPHGKLQPSSAWILYGPATDTDVQRSDTQGSYELGEVYELVRLLDSQTEQLDVLEDEELEVLDTFPHVEELQQRLN